MKTLILLVEGLAEEIVYSSILERLYGGRQVKCRDAPTPLKTLIGPLMRRAKCYTLEHGDLAVIANCGGYENLKNMIRQLLLRLRRRKLLEALRQLDLRIAVAADRDKNPAESIRGVISSMGLQATGGDALTVELGNGAKLAIYVIEQGGTATGEIEDELRKLVEALKPELQRATEKVEEAYGPLTDKQKLLIYLALLEHRPKMRELYELFREAVAAASREAILRLGLAKGLGKALGQAQGRAQNAP